MEKIKEMMKKTEELRQKLEVMLPRNKAGNDMLRAIISMAKQQGKEEKQNEDFKEIKEKLDILIKMHKPKEDKGKQDMGEVMRQGEKDCPKCNKKMIKITDEHNITYLQCGCGHNTKDALQIYEERF